MPTRYPSPLPLGRFLSLALLIAAVAIPNVAAANPQQNRTIGLDDLFGGGGSNLYGSLPYINGWLPSGGQNGQPTYLEYGFDTASRGALLLRVDARTGQSKPFYDSAKMETALVATPGIGEVGARQLSEKEEYRLDARAEQALLTWNGDLYVYRFGAPRAVRLTRTPGERETNASFSPDGQSVSWVLKGNLYACPVAAPERARPLTTDGGPKILNGRLDWVYEEELYGRGNTTGYVWSPDSRRIVFLRLDEKPVQPFALINHLPPRQDEEEQYYPKAGDPNPVATLGVVSLDGKAAPRFVDVSRYPDPDRLIVRFGWTPDSKNVFYQVQNRIQTWLDVNVADAATGQTRTLFREKSSAWVETIGENGENPVWLKDGSFLWWSDRTGYRHLYRYRPDGTLAGPVTRGEWEVKKLHGIDEKSGTLYFDSNAHSAIARHAYRARLDGTGSPVRLTEREGSHEVRFDPSFTYYLDTWSRVGQPEELRLHEAATGKEVRLLGDNEELKKTLTRYRISKPELMQVKTRDGFVMEAMLVKPVDFDPTKKYPVICPVYGGPSATPGVRDEWGGGEFWEDQMWAQKGFIVWRCDNRSASGKGARWAWTTYKQLGPGELRDIEDGVDGLIAAHPYADKDRVGITGWSYGGFMVQYALTHSKRFKAGVSGAGVADWRLYDTIYTERYMSTPALNPEGYKATSPITAASDLTGDLLLIHGLMDDNVHVQNSLQFAHALQRAGKKFEMMLYPGPSARHGFGDRALARHQKTLEIDFLTQKLSLPNTPH